ncbi:MAG: 3,4-dihydroxy-2-butanone-4-phosphate synthase, partial [Rhodospirillaceae bacterium]|nr:3,4-dihydroxy-2-butanone-4-phosphate synthase [Rhodospirillaceae bacterium]
VVVIIREWYDMMLSDRVHERNGEVGKASDKHNAELRDYGVGAQILLELGVKNMILLSNAPKKIIGIDGYGLNVVDHQTIPGLKD